MRQRSSVMPSSAKIGTVTATADANASVICMASLFCAPVKPVNPAWSQTLVAASRFSRAVWVSGWSGPSARSLSASVRSNSAWASVYRPTVW